MSSLSMPDLSFLNKKTSSYKENKNYDNVFVLGMLTSFFTIFLIFMLVAINNIWIFMGFFIFSEIVLIWQSITSTKTYYPAIVLFIIGSIIILWQYKNEIHIFKKKKKENFYTLFKPYQPYPEQQSYLKDINISALSNATSNTGNLLKYRNKTLLFGYELSKKKLAIFISKLLISESKILNVELNPNKSPENICDDLYKYNLDVALLPAPIVNRAFMGYLPGFEGEHMTNLNFIANVQHQYLFCISSVKSGVQSIHQLVNKRLGIPHRLKSIWSDIENSIFPDGHSIVFTFDNEYKLIQDLNDSKIDSVFYAGEYPNPFINEVISSAQADTYKLVPIMFKNKVSFLQKNNSYRTKILKLTYEYMPSNYLPTGVCKFWQSNYTPDYQTIGYDMVLISNNKMDNFTGYEIAKTIYFGRKLIIRNTNINNLNYIGDPFPPVDITNPSLSQLNIQYGSKKFYIEKGLINYSDDPSCISTIGITRCNKFDN